MAEAKQQQHDRDRLAPLRADTREVWHSPRVVNVSAPTAMPGAPAGSPRASSRREARTSGWWIALHRRQAGGCTSLDEGRSLLLPAACDAMLAFETKAVAQMVLEIRRQTGGGVDPSGDRDARGKRQRRLWATCGHKHVAFLWGSSSHTHTSLQKALKEGSIVRRPCHGGFA
jgi:hypothetical protein